MKVISMKIASILAAAALVLAPCAASAQTAPHTPSPAVQTLNACLAHATTADDNTVLMRWIFVALSRHPSVAQYANITDAQRTDASRQMGALLNRLLLDACPNETRAVLQADGAEGLQAAGQGFGQRAVAGLMGNADVSASVSDMTSYLDLQRFAALMSQN